MFVLTIRYPNTFIASAKKKYVTQFYLTIKEIKINNFRTTGKIPYNIFAQYMNISQKLVLS